jgi:hypothetical protein
MEKLKTTGVVTICSKDKKTRVELPAEAKAAVRRKPIADKRLLRMLVSIAEISMPDSAEVRMLALEALYGRGYKVFTQLR